MQSFVAATMCLLFCRNLQRSLAYRKRGTLQTPCPLWSTSRGLQRTGSVPLYKYRTHCGLQTEVFSVQEAWHSTNTVPTVVYKQRSLAYRKRGTLQTSCPLWSTNRGLQRTGSVPLYKHRAHCGLQTEVFSVQEACHSTNTVPTVVYKQRSLAYRKRGHSRSISNGDLFTRWSWYPCIAPWLKISRSWGKTP